MAVANAYAASGIGFVSYDIYNHGRSDSQEDGDRGYLESFEQLVLILCDSPSVGLLCSPPPPPPALP